MANVQSSLTQTIASTSMWIALVLVLAGCSLWEFGADPRPVKQIETVTTSVEKTRLNFPNPKPADIDNVNWTIITPQNAEKVFKELQEAGQDPVIFGLTDSNYKSLSYNFSQIRGFIIEQRLILDKYRTYYEPADNETIDKE